MYIKENIISGYLGNEGSIIFRKVTVEQNQKAIIKTWMHAKP